MDIKTQQAANVSWHKHVLDHMIPVAVVKPLVSAFMTC